MLQTIREYTQGWIAGTIVTIIILTFVMWGVHSYFEGGANVRNVAEVNGVPITKEQLAVAYERLRRQAQSQFGSTMPLQGKDENSLKSRALQSLVDMEVLKQASLTEGFRVSDRQINNYLQSVPEFQVDGQFSIDRFQQLLSSTMLSTSEFLELIRTSLLIDQPKLGIVLTSYALPDEASSTIGIVNQERNFDYLTIPLQYFQSQPITIDPANIQAYYNAHKDDFKTPDQVTVEYLQLNLKDVAARITPTDTMLKNFYNENINAYTQPMQWKIDAIEIPLSATASPEEIKQVRDKADAIAIALRNGGDFDKVAHGYAVTLSGKDWMTLGQIPPDLQKAVASLNKAGQVAEPFRTSKGVGVAMVVSIQEPKMQTFEMVKDKVRDTYIHQHAEEKLAELRDRLADLTYEHPESLQAASKELNLPVNTSELFTQDKPGKDISQYKKVRDVAFSNDVLTLQNNSDVIQLNPETMIVLRVKSHIASTLLPLSSISKQIEDKLRTQEAEARAQQFATEWQAKLQAGANPQQLADATKIAWKKAGFIGRYNNKIDSAVLDLVFRLPNPDTNHGKVSFGSTRLPNGYAIIALSAVKPGTIADKKQVSVFAEQVQNSEGLLEYELYKRSQMSDAKITGM